MIIRPGDEIKIRSFKSVGNEFGEDRYNSRFVGWGKSVEYASVKHVTLNYDKLIVILDGRLITVDFHNIEHGENNTYI